jgi:hypothetical protein
MTDPDALESRVRAVERLAQMYKVERLAYLAITVTSFLILLAVAIRLLYRDPEGWKEWAGLLLGPSGLIAITANRLLRMWTQSLRMVASEPIDGGQRGRTHE